MIYYDNTNQVKAGVAIFVADKANFSKENYQKKRGTLYNDNETNSQRNLIPNVYMPTKRASKYVRQKLVGLQGEICESTITFGDFSIPVSVMDISSSQKTNKDILEQHQLTGYNGHLLTIMSKTSRIQILLKLTWTIHQDKLTRRCKTYLNKYYVLRPQ